MELKNFHTHTTYCDGKNTAEEMILAAVNQGFTALGFSGHSHTSIDPSYCMTTADTRRYIDEIKALRKKYADKIRIYIGLEADLYTDETDLSEFDYTIGSVHYVEVGGVYIPVDESPAQHQTDYVNKYFGGSFISFSQAYYENVAKLGEKINPSFVGHFDLVTKFNENDCLFSTKDPRYIEAWQAAADELLKLNVPFEINTGAIARKCRVTPYPALEIAEYITERGGEFILSSDCHDADFLSCGFDECPERYSNCRIVDFEERLKNKPNDFGI
jgi:histidinol-phosphatase (PHP family)